MSPQQAANPTQRVAQPSSSLARENPPRQERETTETPADGSTADTPANNTLAQQHAAVVERIRQLTALQALQKQEQELMEQLAITSQPYTAKTRRRRDSNESTSSGGGEIKVKNIRQLKLPVELQARDEWLSDLQRAFEGAPRKYRKPAKRILLALDNMDGECRTRWERYLDEQSEEDRLSFKEDWDYFEEWSNTLLKDAAHQDLILISQLARAHQRELQSPREFHIYLDSLEKRFPRAEEKMRALNLYSKLRPELQQHIRLHTQDISKTREEMVSLATRFWDSIKHGVKRKATETLTQSSSKSGYKKPRGNQPPRNRFSNPNQIPIKNNTGKDRKPLKCFTYQSDEHLADRCPKRDENQQKSQGNDRRLK
ncbi:hypothetical protein PT974_11372 [Cladobotryum mycophilum]|uniref:Retrotransposon gag domain-containing protein n=1 Tax=Cladobotryum mycophilum TaxID=491253 RepID=A0ABR0S508_9HYPO